MNTSVFDFGIDREVVWGRSLQVKKLWTATKDWVRLKTLRKKIFVCLIGELILFFSLVMGNQIRVQIKCESI